MCSLETLSRYDATNQRLSACRIAAFFWQLYFVIKWLRSRCTHTSPALARDELRVDISCLTCATSSRVQRVAQRDAWPRLALQQQPPSGRTSARQQDTGARSTGEPQWRSVSGAAAAGTRLQHAGHFETSEPNHRLCSACTQAPIAAALPRVMSECASDAVAATAFAPGHISPCSCMPMCMVSVCSYNVQGHPPFNVATKRFNKHDVGTSLGGLCRECAGRRDVQSTCHMPPSPHKAVHCTVPMQTKSIEGPEYHVAYRDTTAQETRRSTKVSIPRRSPRHTLCYSACRGIHSTSTMAQHLLLLASHTAVPCFLCPSRVGQPWTMQSSRSAGQGPGRCSPASPHVPRPQPRALNCSLSTPRTPTRRACRSC